MICFQGLVFTALVGLIGQEPSIANPFRDYPSFKKSFKQYYVLPGMVPIQ